MPWFLRCWPIKDRLAEIMAAMENADPVVRIRAADVAEKVTAVRPQWLAPFRKMLLRLLPRAEQAELRWHLAQMLPRLALSASERRITVQTMFAYLDDQSRIVQTSALQALADLAEDDPVLRRRLVPVLARLARSGPPSVRARARKLIAQRQR